MPHHLEFDAARKILVAVLEGEVGNQELLKIYDELKGIAGKLVASAGVIDLSEVTTFAVDSSTIRWLAGEPPSFPEALPRFIVAPKSEIFGMSRMYELIAERPALQVVRTREAALAALGVPEPRFEKLAST